MNIEIDQSGKIENTSVSTVVAFTNDHCESIVIGAQDKREVQEIFRKIGKPKSFIYRLFSTLVFMLLRGHLKEIKMIVIDKEYPGKEKLIKAYLLAKIRKTRPDFFKDDIVFKSIGRKSRAHDTTYLTLKRRKLPDKVVKASEVLKNIFK